MKSRRARSRRWKCKLEASHDHPGTLRGRVPASALADGAHDQRYDLLVSIHRPLGIAILVLCVARIVNRFINPPPDLPDTVSPLQRFAATASHIVLYALMLMMPLVGWGMLSAARYPIVFYGPLRLPPILPHDLTLYASLRDLHTILAYLLFATFLAHFGAALYHGLIRRDGVFGSMASWEQGSMQFARTNPASIQNSTQTPES